MAHLRQRLLQMKMLLLGIAFTLLRACLIAIAKWMSVLVLGPRAWLHSVPLGEIGSSLFAIGLLGVAYDCYTRRDEEENATRRLRKTLRREAPVMRDAVIRAFAFRPEDLERVATPALLDKLATNSLALRLDDPQSATEIHADLLAQAITASERLNKNGIPRTFLKPDTAKHPYPTNWEYYLKGR